MNLLTDTWVSVKKGKGRDEEFLWLGLKEILTSSESLELRYPRDDLEMAALEMLIALTQVIFIPEDNSELIKRGKSPLSEGEYEEGVENFLPWFDLSSQEKPFMQVRGVNAKELTPMEKLLPGVNSSTNSNFVNEPGLGTGLCDGCTALALFNQASNAPGFGGGFKSGLRGGAPVTTLISGRTLRETIWLNVMTRSFLNLNAVYPEKNDEATWVCPIRRESVIPSSDIGLLRGLFWQPAHIELSSPEGTGVCSCCGRSDVQLFTGFKKEKFNFTVKGLWKHPYSPQLLSQKNDIIEKKYLAFTTSAPSWTRLNSMVVEREIQDNVKEGFTPALNIQSYKERMNRPDTKLILAIGGYRNNKASILERRHERLEISSSLLRELKYLPEIVSLALEYKKILRGGLYSFTKGYAEIRGAGIELSELGEASFYKRTELDILSLLAHGDFESRESRRSEFGTLGKNLKEMVLSIFDELTRAYIESPFLIQTAAVCRRNMLGKIKKLKMEVEEEPL